MQSLPFSRRQGFSLVEVILAVGVLSMAILALVGLVGSTFQQVDEVVQTNRAIGVVAAVNAALDNPELVGGERLPNATDINKSKFSVVYDFVKSAVNNQKVVLYYFSKEIDNGSGGTSVVSVVYKAPGDNFSRSIYNEQNGIGPVFRVEIAISKLLEGQRIELDTSTYEQKDAVYSGGSLPGSADEYALAYLPLFLEVYPHEFADISVTQDRAIRPILSQNIIINI